MKPAAAPFRAAPFAVLWLCYFAFNGLFMPYSPLWLSHLGYSTLAIGAFAALQSWTRIVAPYGWGWLADHGGRRVALLRLAALISAAAAGALWFAGEAGMWPLTLAMALLFLANGAVTPIAETLLLKHLHDGTGLDAHRYGRVRLWGSIGFIASVLLSGWVLQGAGISSLPLLCFVPTVALVAAAWRLPASADGPSATQRRAAVAPVLRRPVVRWFFACVMLTVLAHSALYAFFSLYLAEMGYAKPWVGALWAVAVAAEIAFFAVAGRFFARLDMHRWLVVAAGASALRFAATAAFGDVAAVLLLAQTLHCITFAAQHMACTSLIARYFPDELRARGSALYSVLGYGVPGVLGGLAGGWISERLGLAAVFWAAALVSLAAAACGAMAWRVDNADAAGRARLAKLP